jgi:Tol biopolymer transport system component
MIHNILFRKVDMGKIRYILFSLLILNLSYGFDQRNLAVELRTRVESSYPYWSPDGSKIVFQSDRLDNNNEIYIMSSDGTNLVRLTNNSSADLTPVWSPDGSQIAFQSDRDGNTEIYLMNIDGTYQRNITHFEGEDMHPKWSSDGKKILFSSIRGYWNLVDIYEINTDGTGLKRITRSVEIDTYAEWSPDMSQIITRRIIAGEPNSEIFLLRPDGSGPVNLTNDPAFDGWPSWHPEGEKIVFASEDENGDASLYQMNISDGSKELILNAPGSWAKPIWSRDGSKLIFTRSLAGIVDIYVMYTSDKGTFENPVKITDVQDIYPQVSADGKTVLFQSNRSGNWQIFIMNSEGGEIQRLTFNEANDTMPAWSPDGIKIFFFSDRDGQREKYSMNIDGSRQMRIF